MGPMINSMPLPNRQEIWGRLSPERIARAQETMARFATQRAQVEVPMPENFDLVISGIPDFVGKTRADGTVALRRVWLPRRHLLVEQVVEPLDTKLLYGSLDGPTADDRSVALFKLITQAPRIIGIFEDRLPKTTPRSMRI